MRRFGKLGIVWLFTVLLMLGCVSTTTHDTDEDGTDKEPPENKIPVTPVNPDNSMKLFSITPTTGHIDGGTEVSIIGANFVGSAEVFFGSKKTDAQVMSKTRISATSPMADSAGVVDIKVVISGKELILASAFTYIEAKAGGLDWCRINNAAVEGLPNQPAGHLYVEFYEEGCTPDLSCSPKVELGVIAADADSSDLNAWQWSDAQKNDAFASAEGNNNVEFMAQSTLAAGEYKAIFRVTIGEDVAYCGVGDKGALKTIAEADPATISVRENVKSVEYCVVQHPKSMQSTYEGETLTSENVYGRVYVPNCTENAEPCEGLEAELGIGPWDVDPSATPEAYVWGKAIHNPAFADEKEPNNDEYIAKVQATAAGKYGYVYRFRTSETAAWVYCDADPEKGFMTDKKTAWTVLQKGEETRKIHWANIQTPESLLAEPNVESVAIYGQVYVENCTQGDGLCEGLSAELGYGAIGSDPRNQDFTWKAATHNKEFKGNIRLISQKIDNENKTINVHGHFTDKDKLLKVGNFISAQILLKGRVVYAVPQDAIVEIEDKKVLFVEEHKNEFKITEVTTGMKDNGFVEIKSISGNNFDINIVTQGAYFLKGEMLKGEMDGHGHAH